MGKWNLKWLPVIATETLRNPIVHGAVVFGALRRCAPGTVTTEQALSAGMTVCCASSFFRGLETIGGGLADQGRAIEGGLSSIGRGLDGVGAGLASIGQALDGMGAGCRALGTDGLTVRRVALPSPHWLRPPSRAATACHIPTGVRLFASGPPGCHWIQRSSRLWCSGRSCSSAPRRRAWSGCRSGRRGDHCVPALWEGCGLSPEHAPVPVAAEEEPPLNIVGEAPADTCGCNIVACVYACVRIVNEKEQDRNNAPRDHPPRHHGVLGWLRLVALALFFPSLLSRLWASSSVQFRS